MKRSNSTFAILMIVIAVFMGGLSSFTGVAGGGSSMMLVFYWYLLPMLPFLILAGFSQIKNMSNAGLIGAVFGAGAAIIVPYLLMLVSSGGGANIGLGLLILAMPIYIPILMVIGYFLGKRTEGHTE